MVDFFSGIWSVISSVWNWVINIIESLIRMLNLVSYSIPGVVYLAGFMPSVISTCVLVVLSLAIIKIIVGR